MRILFPTDGSTATEEAFTRMLDLFDGSYGEMTITVLNVVQEGFEGADPQYLEETYESDERDEVFPSAASSKRAIQRCSELATKRGLEVQGKTVTGNYVDAILTEAEDHDILVMHELRRSGLKDKLKGSGTEKIARRAPCSVLLVQTEEIA